MPVNVQVCFVGPAYVGRVLEDFDGVGTAARGRNERRGSCVGVQQDGSICSGVVSTFVRSGQGLAGIGSMPDDRGQEGRTFFAG